MTRPRGGKREGAGRPPKPEGRLTRYTISVPPEQFEWVRAHGGAKRIRALIAAAMRQEEEGR